MRAVQQCNIRYWYLVIRFFWSLSMWLLVSCIYHVCAAGDGDESTIASKPPAWTLLPIQSSHNVYLHTRLTII